MYSTYVNFSNLRMAKHDWLSSSVEFSLYRNNIIITILTIIIIMTSIKKDNNNNKNSPCNLILKGTITLIFKNSLSKYGE